MDLYGLTGVSSSGTDFSSRIFGGGARSGAPFRCVSPRDSGRSAYSVRSGELLPYFKFDSGALAGILEGLALPFRVGLPLAAAADCAVGFFAPAPVAVGVLVIDRGGTFFPALGLLGADLGALTVDGGAPAGVFDLAAGAPFLALSAPLHLG